jgi:GrpB-like predicted nucleotidyltransferase (UPF0157 family)
VGKHQAVWEVGKSALEILVIPSSVSRAEALKNLLCTNGTTDLKTVQDTLEDEYSSRVETSRNDENVAKVCTIVT